MSVGELRAQVKRREERDDGEKPRMGTDEGGKKGTHRKGAKGAEKSELRNTRKARTGEEE